MLPSHHFHPPDEEDLYQPPIHLHRPPAGHGPAPRALPTFVKAVNQYDELGNVKAAGVSVDDGKVKGRDGKAWDWWKGLELGGKPMSVGGTAKGEEKVVESDQAADGQGSTSSGTASESDTTRNRKRSTSPSQQSPSSSLAPQPLTSTTAPVKIQIPRSQWFIRKALLAKAQSSSSTSPTPDTSSTSTPSPSRPATPSLASLIDIAPPSASDAAKERFRPPAYYHLTEEGNVGYRMLKSQGWDDRGGLGRVAGSGGSDGEAAGSWDESAVKDVKPDIKAEEGIGNGKGKGKAADDAIDIDAVVDLTGDTSSEDDSEAEDDVMDHHPAPSLLVAPSSSSSSSYGPAPGRTAPIPTLLKSDLSGIGHHSAKRHLRPSSSSLASSSTAANRARAEEARAKKRVTHSEADIRAMRRGKVLDGRVVGKKEVKKRKEREREEMKMWRGAIM